MVHTELFGNPESTNLVVLIAGHEEAQAVFQECGISDFSLLAIGGIDWNRDLSPWPAPAVFKGGEDFAGGADAFLEVLEKAIPVSRKRIFLAGYSLAGLFAVYAATRTNRFTGVVSASGSLWYPGFRAYLAEHPMKVASAYFSLGDKEAKTKNKVMQTVEENTVAISQGLMGIRTNFERNPGGHFADAPKRLAKGIRWILGA